MKNKKIDNSFIDAIKNSNLPEEIKKSACKDIENRKLDYHQLDQVSGGALINVTTKVNNIKQTLIISSSGNTYEIHLTDELYERYINNDPNAKLMIDLLARKVSMANQIDQVSGGVDLFQAKTEKKDIEATIHVEDADNVLSVTSPSHGEIKKSSFKPKIDRAMDNLTEKGWLTTEKLD